MKSLLLLLLAVSEADAESLEPSVSFFRPILRHNYTTRRPPPPAGNTVLTEGSPEISQHTTVRCSYSVSQKIPPPRGLLTFFPKRFGIFSPNFRSLLYVPIYTQLQIFIQLPATLTKLCHIKCDHPACVSADGGHFEHIMVVALNMA